MVMVMVMVVIMVKVGCSNGSRAVILWVLCVCCVAPNCVLCGLWFWMSWLNRSPLTEPGKNDKEEEQRKSAMYPELDYTHPNKRPSLFLPFFLLSGCRFSPELYRLCRCAKRAAHSKSNV
ncbi:hypothetical protein F4861DRAFT_491171 [Xylaria intraflava]|nr:hypothetical protein F4861DRAFT_491171 [Xylaria intraflava]